MFKTRRRDSSDIEQTNSKSIQSYTLTDDEKTSLKNVLRRKVTSCKLPCKIRTDDTYMTRWLSICDWDIDAAYKRMMRLFKFRKEHPDWYFTRHPRAYDQLLKRNMAGILDGRDKYGRRMYVMHIERMNQDEVTIEEMAQVDDIWMEMIYDEPETLDNGLVFLIDMKGISWKILKWFTPKNSYYSSILVDSAPLKHYELQIINTSPFVHTLGKMVLPFLVPSFRNRIRFHGTDLTDLNEQLGEDALPEEYGGKQGRKIDYNVMQKNLYLVHEKKEDLISYTN